MKNYKKPSGVSTKVFNAKASTDTFKIKGPMGRGLMLQPHGVHVAFSAGTGALVFLDLVARIILSNSQLLPIQKSFSNDFKFLFYCSFKDEKHAIGLQLCKNLIEMNKKLKLNNFQFTLRLAEDPLVTIDTRPPRWDRDYIMAQLKPLEGKI
jgi:hypothetical protein